MANKWSLLILLCTPMVYAQEYVNRSQGFTTLPSDIPADVILIDVKKNKIASFSPGDFSPFYQLQVLTISVNPFTEFPDLRPVAGTLTRVNAFGCKMTTINEDMFNELIVLKVVMFANSMLMSFPNVPGPGSTLTYLNCDGCQLEEFPTLGNYKVLDQLLLSDNPMTSMQDSALDGLEALSKLLMRGTSVEAFPDNPKVLQNLITLKASDSLTIKTIPLTCPRQSLTIQAQNSPVSLCSCDNVWLSALHGQRGTVTMDDMTCGSATSTEDIIRAACQRPQIDGKREAKATLKHQDFLCEFPVASYITGVSNIECMIWCMDAVGCQSYSYRETGTRVGSCVIVAPTDSALPLTAIDDAEEPGWMYFQVN